MFYNVQSIGRVVFFPGIRIFFYAYDGWDVNLGDVFFYHPAHAELGRQGADRFFDAPDPFSWQVIRAAVGVEQRDDFIFQSIVQAFGIGSILNVGVRILGVIANGPSIITVITFSPPSIQDGEIEYTV